MKKQVNLIHWAVVINTLTHYNYQLDILVLLLIRLANCNQKRKVPVTRNQKWQAESLKLCSLQFGEWESDWKQWPCSLLNHISLVWRPLQTSHFKQEADTFVACELHHKSVEPKSVEPIFEHLSLSLPLLHPPLCLCVCVHMCSRVCVFTCEAVRVHLLVLFFRRCLPWLSWLGLSLTMNLSNWWGSLASKVQISTFFYLHSSGLLSALHCAWLFTTGSRDEAKSSCL